MDILFLEGEWAEYLDSVNSELEKADEDGLDSGSERVVGLVLNRGHAELKLGLGRKAVASAQLALRSGPCLKACLLKAKAWHLLGNSTNEAMALREAEDILGGKAGGIDSFLLEELREMKETMNDNGSGEEGVPHAPPTDQSAAKINTNRKPPPPPYLDDTVMKSKDGQGNDQAVQAVAVADGDDDEEETIDFDISPGEVNERQEAVPRELLQSVYDGLMRNFGQPVGTDILAQARGSLAHASGDDLVDSLIALGYLQVNTGNLDMACEIFQLLLGYKSSLTACHMAMGSVRAMQRNYGAAVISFDAAIDLCPESYDAWKRRGQTRAAMGDSRGGYEDLVNSKRLFFAEMEGGGRPSCSSEYAKEEQADVAYQLGLVCHQMKNFRDARQYFLDAKECGLASPQLLNFLGMCEGQLGNVGASLSYHGECRSLVPSFKECVLNMAQMLKEQGKFKESEKLFTEAIHLYLAQKEKSSSLSSAEDDGANICDPSSSKSFDESIGTAYRYRAQLYYGAGDRVYAIRDFEAALRSFGKAEKTVTTKAIELETRVLLAVTKQAVGDLRGAVDNFNSVLEEDGESYCLFLREIAIKMAIFACKPLSFTRSSASSPDAQISPYVKLGACKKVSRGTLMIESRVNIEEIDAGPSLASFDAHSEQHGIFPKEVATRLLQAVSQVGMAVFLKCPGFLPNSVQARQFGLAVLYTSTAFRQQAEAGNQVRSADEAEDTRGNTGWSWRQVFDQAVRWRQLSEPQDPVWWIDGMPSRDFTEGFGLQTPMVNGQLNAVRYSSYFGMAFDTMKRIMTDRGYYDAVGEQLLIMSKLPESKQDEVRKASTLDELYAAVGTDFFVIVPCTLSGEEKPQEGTRVTLVKDDDPPGYQFTIRTPGTPDRWKSFDGEMERQFQAAVQAITETSGAQGNIEGVLRAALSVFYYWVIFGPLSRGTAATGYVALHAILAAAGVSVSAGAYTGLPPGKQLDWEAILAPSKEAFMDLALSWYLPTIEKATFITTAPFEDCACCQVAPEEDHWAAWGEPQGSSFSANLCDLWPWRWVGLHNGDLQRVRTGYDMLSLLNAE